MQALGSLLLAALAVSASCGAVKGKHGPEFLEIQGSMAAKHAEAEVRMKEFMKRASVVAHMDVTPPEVKEEMKGLFKEATEVMKKGLIEMGDDEAQIEIKRRRKEEEDAKKKRDKQAPCKAEAAARQARRLACEQVSRTQKAAKVKARADREAREAAKCAARAQAEADAAVVRKERARELAHKRAVGACKARAVQACKSKNQDNACVKCKCGPKKAEVKTVLKVMQKKLKRSKAKCRAAIAGKANIFRDSDCGKGPADIAAVSIASDNIAKAEAEFQATTQHTKETLKAKLKSIADEDLQMANGVKAKSGIVATGASEVGRAGCKVAEAIDVNGDPVLAAVAEAKAQADAAEAKKAAAQAAEAELKEKASLHAQALARAEAAHKAAADARAKASAILNQ